MANAIARIKELQKEATSLMTAAKKEALDKINAALAELRELGFHYTLSGGGATKTRVTKRSGRKGARTIKDAPCVICNFRTVPPHDARKHRFTQGKKKKPFTPQELQKLGLKKA
jgi:hypothetical protein